MIEKKLTVTTKNEINFPKKQKKYRFEKLKI